MEEPFDYQPYCQLKKRKVIAIFSYDTIISTGMHNNDFYVIGQLPKQYKSGKLIKVNVCLDPIPEPSGIQLHVVCPTVFKLKCIERED